MCSPSHSIAIAVSLFVLQIANAADAEANIASAGCPEGRVDPIEPQPRFWTAVEAHEPCYDAWKERCEHESRLRK